MSIAERIREKIEGMPQGELFTSAAFLQLGSRAAVDQALARMARSESILRVSRGMFVRPRVNRFVGKVPPGTAQIIQAISQKNGETVQVHGAEAVRALGLSTQVPLRLVYLTTGPSRHMQVGNQIITFKRTSPRKLLLAERTAGIALTALWYLGKGQVDPEVIERIRRKLPAKEFAALKSVLPSMPGWMVKAFQEHERRFAHV